MRTYAFNTLTEEVLSEIAVFRYELSAPKLWEELERYPLPESDRFALKLVSDKLLYYSSHRVNEATIWARAIYPLLMLAERGSIRAWSLVPLAAKFEDMELRGEADGALAASLNEVVGRPFVVIMESKRGTNAPDPVPQLLGAMLCAARLNEDSGCPTPELFGAYTIADVWTFVRCRFEWTQPKPTVSVLTSREYAEKLEAATILSILDAIVAQQTG